MTMLEWWSSLELAAQVFYCIAVPATLVLLIQTVLLFFGFEDGAEGEIPDDIPDVPDVPDVDVNDGVFGEDSISDIPDAAGLESLHIFTVRGIVAFFVVFGWVGAVMQSAGQSLLLTLPTATICGFAMMVAIAYLLRAVMRLRSNGAADIRNALGAAGKVYLAVPPSRTGEGKVHIMLQGSYVERNAVTDETKAIPTGCEIVVVGVSGQTSLVVKRK